MSGMMTTRFHLLMVPMLFEPAFCLFGHDQARFDRSQRRDLPSKFDSGEVIAGGIQVKPARLKNQLSGYISGGMMLRLGLAVPCDGAA